MAHTRVHLVQRPTRPGVAPVHVDRPDPALWTAALRLADGDPRRLVRQPDGSVLVLNTRP
jgi:hypothetical protein